ncbi:MAG: hypothetical protein QOF21_2654, partial [Actinomycetota bacterium]
VHVANTTDTEPQEAPVVAVVEITKRPLITSLAKLYQAFVP